MEAIELNIASQYHRKPGPRYIIEGSWSGEKFRREKLLPEINKAISEKKKLIVNLDGTAGYATSFLEESFGGLIRVEGMDYKVIIDTIDFISNEEPFLIDDIKAYLKDAYEAKSKQQ